jgi:hypothetical protein
MGINTQCIQRAPSDWHSSLYCCATYCLHNSFTTGTLSADQQTNSSSALNQHNSWCALYLVLQSAFVRPTVPSESRSRASGFVSMWHKRGIANSIADAFERKNIHECLMFLFSLITVAASKRHTALVTRRVVRVRTAVSMTYPVSRRYSSDATLSAWPSHQPS